MTTRATALLDNGTVRRVLVGMIAPVLVAIGLALAMVWKNSVDSAGVSRQIELEAPAALSAPLKEIKDEVKEVRQEQMKQRIMLERIDEAVRGTEFR